MLAMALVICTVIGLGVGIVLNVLADELSPTEPAPAPRVWVPRCGSCGAVRPSTGWLALLSPVLGTWRCQTCHAPRPWRQVVVELATAAGFALAWQWAAHGPVAELAVLARFLSAVVVLSAAILIAVIDIEHRLILFVIVIPAAAAVTFSGWAAGRDVAAMLWGGLAGFGVVLGVFLLGQLFSLVVALVRGRPPDEIVFGGGDVVLAGLIGLMVGWPAILLALLIATLASGAFSAGYLMIQILRRRYRAFTPIPHGPFLLLGGLALYFFSDVIVRWMLAR